MAGIGRGIGVDPRAPAVRRSIGAVAVAALVLFATFATGTIDGSNQALVIMGFDPDRAALITALLVGAVVALAAELASGSGRAAWLFGCAAALGLFAPTFVAETDNAIRGRTGQAAFSPEGWLLTAVTLLVIAAVVAWVGVTLAIPLRRRLSGDLAVVGSAVRQRRRPARRDVLRPAVTLAAVILLGVTMPAFGTLVNFTPDSLMLAGGAGAPLVGPGTTTEPATSPTATPTASMPASSPSPTASGPALSPSPTATPHPDFSDAKPWATHPPTGRGQLIAETLPAPWKGGSQTASVSYYLPPGYDATLQPYPVVYETPWGADSWVNGVQMTSMLDSLITSGQIPPQIVVFISQIGAPVVYTECIDTPDGRQWMETFVADTVVHWVDEHLRTIQSPAARSLLGMSEGGYCSAMLLLRHPDVFGSAMAFGGYYESGPNAAQTVNAYRLFGSDQALRDKYNPLKLAPALDAAVRRDLFVVLVGASDQPFFGPQMDAFADVLKQASYLYRLVEDPYGHSWVSARTQLPGVLGLVASRMVALGVFG